MRYVLATLAESSQSPVTHVHPHPMNQSPSSSVSCFHPRAMRLVSVCCCTSFSCTSLTYCVLGYKMADLKMLSASIWKCKSLAFFFKKECTNVVLQANRLEPSQGPLMWALILVQACLQILYSKVYWNINIPNRMCINCRQSLKHITSNCSWYWRKRSHCWWQKHACLRWQCCFAPLQKVGQSTSWINNWMGYAEVLMILF